MADAPHPAWQERSIERQALVNAVAAEGPISSSAVLAALNKVPRHHFVSAELQQQAYLNVPLPIGHGQTIGQPQIVATMTESVRPRPSDRCLEIGTGCGYQTAILAELCSSVCSVEYLPEVAALGAKNLRALGYLQDRVQLRIGDGASGWPERAPFDVVLVTAAPLEVPPALLQQLALGGRLVIPVGPSVDDQELELWQREKPGRGYDAFRREVLMGVRFVPFLGAAPR